MELIKIIRQQDIWTEKSVKEGESKIQNLDFRHYFNYFSFYGTEMCYMSQVGTESKLTFDNIRNKGCAENLGCT